MKKYIPIVAFFLFSSCIKDLDLPFPQSKDQIVINGLLHPDSILSVKLTLTSALNTTEKFEVVKNAQIIIKENGKILGEMEFIDSVYVFNAYPLEGHRYCIEVNVSGYPTLTASDVVPFASKVSACYFENNKITSYVWIRTTIFDNNSYENYYWLNLLVNYKLDQVEKYFAERLFYIRSFSNIPDNFNSSIDNSSDGAKEYRHYIRIDDATLKNKIFSLDISGFDPLFRYSEMKKLNKGESIILTTLSASQHFDRYLKSSLIYFMNTINQGDITPFLEPIQIYSNVVNGTGIFAAYNTTSVEVSNLCNEQ